MNPNSYDSYQDINKSNNSAVAIILSYIGLEDIDELCQTEQLKSNFARNYSTIKRNLFNFDNQIDFKFCIFENKPIQITDTQGNITYSPPTNFIRFLRNDKGRNNVMILARSNSTGMANIFNGNFPYIGYVKDSNPDIQIPFDFHDMVAYRMLRSDKMFTDRITQIDISNINIKFLEALQRLKESYL